MPVVVLAHVLPDGGRHWDLLVAQDAQGKLPLWSVRCTERPDTAVVGTTIQCEVSLEHDPRWLAVRREVLSGGRGVAERVAGGLLCVGEQGRAIVQWSGGQQSEWQLMGGHLLVLS